MDWSSVSWIFGELVGFALKVRWVDLSLAEREPCAFWTLGIGLVVERVGVGSRRESLQHVWLRNE